MKDADSINENELDGALNALFLDTYSQKEDQEMARLCMEQEYNVIVNSKKEAELLAKLSGKRGGGNMRWMISSLVLIIGLSFFFMRDKKENRPAGQSGNKIVSAPQQITNRFSETNSERKQTLSTTPSQNGDEVLKPEPSVSGSVVQDQQINPSAGPAPEPPSATSPPKDVSLEEKILPYFNKEGLAYFAKVKEQMLQRLIKIDDKLYTKTEPGSTMYKSREMLVPPFVLSNQPVTNLQYKTFLADLARQGRNNDLKKCLPKEEVWKKYGCTALAKNYFESESYNNFPVVNVGKEASAIFCEWLEEEANKKLGESVISNKKFGESVKSSKVKGSPKKKQVTVRLPYDYEWIYLADAAYALIPNCKGYNTIFDASEGLVGKNFFKLTSQLSKRDLRKETRMDNLADLNRYGMTEAEMIAIFKEAMNYNDGNSKSSVTLSDPASYPYNMEACCLAGHVGELIKNKAGETTVRGCCWKSKEEYLKMMELFENEEASPFIGFRVVILNENLDSYKTPFW